MLVALTTFALAATLLILLPGPDTLVVVRSLLCGGKRIAGRTVLGVLSGLTTWVVTASLGLSAVLRASHDAYLGLRIAGGLYLIWLGVSSLRSRGTNGLGDETGEAAPAGGTEAGTGGGAATSSGRRRRTLIGTGYRAGLLTDLLNPKVGVFFVTFLPVFVPHGDPVGATTLLFGAIFVVLTGLYFTIMLAASKPVIRWMTTPRVRRRMEKGTGIVLIGFGLRLAIEP